MKGNFVNLIEGKERCGNNIENLRLKYKFCFENDMSEPIKDFCAEIVLRENVTPIFHKAYSMPYKVKEKFDAELDKLIEQNIIYPVKYSKWASPLVVVVKSDNKRIRLCVDCKVTINKFIKTEHYPLPRAQGLRKNRS